MTAKEYLAHPIEWIEGFPFLDDQPIELGEWLIVWMGVEGFEFKAHVGLVVQIAGKPWLQWLCDGSTIGGWWPLDEVPGARRCEQPKDIIGAWPM